ncbi:MAG TPA: hypothetical protein VFK41_08520 [Nocardioidaceae bacterium]|nr:hypothetical protein [Nocardioidaceae bacterium]
MTPVLDDLSNDEITRAWAEALDRLERDVVAAEALAAHPERAERRRATPKPWTPPNLPGHLPAGLVGRAQELLRREEEAKRLLAAGLEQIRAERSALGERARSGAAPSAYLDVNA